MLNISNIKTLTIMEKRIFKVLDDNNFKNAEICIFDITDIIEQKENIQKILYNKLNISGKYLNKVQTHVNNSYDLLLDIHIYKDYLEILYYLYMDYLEYAYLENTTFTNYLKTL